MDFSVKPATPFEYDQVDYPGMADDHIQLRGLEFASRMNGAHPKDMDGCRVLELGCADGTNLLPFAVEFPYSSFLGIDLASRRIDQANETVRQLGLTNIQFQLANVADIDPATMGTFDYILCPGVFSWATDDERLAMLNLCKHCLAPGGIAAISFNVLPGWNWSGTLRDFVRYATTDAQNPTKQISEARKAIEFMAENTAPDTLQGVFYRQTRDQAHGWSDAYIYHEYISDRNRPFYFHQFQTMATDHGLRFVAEADFRHSSGFGLSPATRKAVAQSPPDKREQLLDFVLNSGYRKSMLCRADDLPQQRSQREVIAEAQLTLAHSYSNISLDQSSTGSVSLPVANGSVTITDPIALAAISKLIASWPRTFPIAELFDLAMEACRETSPSLATTPRHEGIEMMSRSMIALLGAGVIQAFTRPPRVATTVSIKPAVTPLVRYSASHGFNVVNQWHENSASLSDEDRHLLSLLDGTRDLDQLVQDMQSWMLAQSANRIVDRSQVQSKLETFCSYRLMVD